MGGETTDNATSRNATRELVPGLLNLLTNSMAPATWKTYQRAIEVLIHFLHRYEFNNTLLLPPSVMALWVTHLYEAKYAASTISTFMAAVNYIHKLYNAQEPGKSFLVQKVILGVHKTKPKYDI